MKPALLVIDLQKKFFHLNQTCSDSLKSTIEYINETILLFRDKDFPVIAIQHKNEREGLVEGNEDFEVHESVKLDQQDLRIVKTYGNAFTKTMLAEKLRDFGVDTVILTGFCAEECVLSTYIGADDNDFTPVILRSAIASDNPDHVKFVEEISNLVSIGALKKLLG
jgi:nicotinamidase-related amidase